MACARFPSPFEPTPAGCDGWEEMYPYHSLFSEDRREFDESRFWFHDGMHWPEPIYPFGALVVDDCVVGIGQASARLFAVPPALGIEYRVLNGYVYISPNTITDEATIARRAELFEKRGGYYYGHWNDLYGRWIQKVEREIGKLERLQVPDLAEVEEETVVTESRGYGSSHVLSAAYVRLIEGVDRVLQYHFEFLNLGYAAYVAFYELCRGAYPHITDQTIARLVSGDVSGDNVLLLRPDDELRRLAQRALDLGVADAVRTAGSERGLRDMLSESEAGLMWLADLDGVKDPWFYLSYGNGLAHDHRSWIDDMTLPIATMGSYIERLVDGEDISRPYDRLAAERDRIRAEHRALLPPQSRRAFDESLALARRVFPYVENHNFYIEHRYLTIFWNKVREFGALLTRNGYLDAEDDVFYLRRDEVGAALDEVRLSWSAGGIGAALGPRHWPPVVARRKSLMTAMREWTPHVALGPVPDTITDPCTLMLWGISTEHVREWLAFGDINGTTALSGIAASPGVAEGRARLIFHPDQLGQLEDGEILVARSASPSWTAVFDKVVAAVLDIGGIMSHAAIVARECGLPAVVGTGSATTTIKNGDRIRVDGDAGAVTVLD